jgi:hypothetical protein
MRSRQAKKKALYAMYLKVAKAQRLEVTPVPQRDLDRAIAYLNATRNEFLVDGNSAHNEFPQTGSSVMAGRLARR